MRDDILQIRGLGYSFFVLRDAAGLHLIDTGFIGGMGLLQRGLRMRGWQNQPVRGIILTHGHLDHILNVARMAREFGAWVAAPRLDAAHYAGRARYSGWARTVGILEGIGKPILRFRPFTPDRWIEDGDLLNVWHGLRAMHLPGHTAGHTGYYCAQDKLLFCGDLFASYLGTGRLPPWVFNSDPARIPKSIAAALALDLEGILPTHCNRAEPAEHLRRLRDLSDKLGQR